MLESKIISSTYKVDFKKLLDKALEDGWQIQGNIQVSSIGTDARYTILLVKDNEEDKAD